MYLPRVSQISKKWLVFIWALHSSVTKTNIFRLIKTNRFYSFPYPSQQSRQKIWATKLNQSQEPSSSLAGNHLPMDGEKQICLCLPNIAFSSNLFLRDFGWIDFNWSKFSIEIILKLSIFVMHWGTCSKWCYSSSSSWWSLCACG